ncbi:amidase [Paraglaciecola chathamensis]|uniref:amidase n=1 Tax=Paraglaciecola chathamensis TaxID=368405 RepID=UPI00270C259D|nr:amidase [Paraglaciecola chathamensis]MDO6840888.1 amidase [Paraglaciecola chathamensis]
MSPSAAHFSSQTPYVLSVTEKEYPAKQADNLMLSGVSLAVKDLFHIKGLPTTAGNPDWLASHPTPLHTAPAVETLLENGAQLVGKTITDELAYSLNGQNIHYGTPFNISAPDRIPGGSSSGSAVAVREGSAQVGLGTDTGGSIRVPASYNGLFGLRPTHGRISSEHMVSLAPSFDTVGWITRDLDVLAKVASVFFGDTHIDDASSSQYIAQNSKIGFAQELAQQCEYSEALTTAYHSMVEAPCILESGLSSDSLIEASETFRILQGYEIWQTHGEWITQQAPTFAPDIQQRFAWCATIDNQQRQQALEKQAKFISHINHLFTQCDVIFLPTTPGPAPFIDTPSDVLATYRNTMMKLTCIAGLCGLPQLHVPLPINPHAPMGFSLIGQKNHDKQLIEIARMLLET